MRYYLMRYFFAHKFNLVDLATFILFSAIPNPLVAFAVLLTGVLLSSIGEASCGIK